jgi:8-oxo-dGTP diphosphatase
MPVDPPAPFHPSATRRVRSTVRVGVGVLVWTPNGRLLVGRRRGSHGAGTWALPGGHLDVGESWETCARREVLEEMYIELKDPVEFVHATNDVFDDNNNDESDEQEHTLHYVTIFMQGRVQDMSTLQNCEPDKCEGWEAYSWKELQAMVQTSPETVFLPLRNLILENPPAVQAFEKQYRRQQQE